MSRRIEREERPDPAPDQPILVGGEGGGPGGLWAPVSRGRRKPVRWFIEGRIPWGAVCVLEGRKTSGKGTLAATLAACLTAGQQFGYARAARPRNVLWLGMEESIIDDVQGRLIAAGGDPERLFFPASDATLTAARRLLFPAQMEELARAVQQTEAGLVVLDPLSSFVCEGVNLNDEYTTRRLIEGFGLLAAASSSIVLVIRHLRKGSSGPAVDQGFGSIALGNTARSVMRLDDDPDQQGRRLWSVVALNGAPAGPTLRFWIRDKDGAAFLEWDGESDLTADDLAGTAGDLGERDARADARAFLKEELAAGARKAKDLEELGDEAGLSRGTLRRAKRDLGIVSKPVGSNESRHWMWEIPAKE